MASPTEEYVLARAKVDAFRRQFDEIAKTLDRAGHALRDRPECFAFTNVREPKLPSSAFGVVEVNAMSYPTAIDIQTMLAEFHQAHRAHVDHYAALPADLRSSVAPPRARQREEF
jgi:hypothetical protein